MYFVRTHTNKKIHNRIKMSVNRREWEQEQGQKGMNRNSINQIREGP